MSAEHAKKFADLLDSDPQLKEGVKKTQGNLVDLAAQKGFIVTQEELHEELRARWGIDKPEKGYTVCQNTSDP
ncbi:MAG TPA: Nif11-like leader peptide family natural product precursor [Thermoanaerobaculia bacterium]|nr:Nif11-like leader peptide family natural product precursor [Thermoanaerobaculia bacterium]